MLALHDAPSRPPVGRVALIQNDLRMSFGEFDKRADRWAATLLGKGVAPDDLVAFTRPNGPEFLAVALGIYRAGATPAPLSGKLPPIERTAILDVMRPAAVIGPDDEPAIAAAQTCNHVAASWKACTSGGSTGRPKVIVDARAAAFPAGTDFIGIPEAGTVLVPGPLYHNAPFSAAVFALWRGSTVVTMARFDAEEALATIARERVGWALMVPTMLHRIMALPAEVRARYDLSCWHTVVHTAAPMPSWLKRAWIDWLGPDHIWEVYGATEGLVRCWIGGREWLERPGSVGRPLGGARLRILDDAGADVPVGVTGEVFAMPPDGPGSTYRYIGADRRVTADGWESVGDCGHVDADGYLFLADRRSDLIISGGVNVWPAEVEAALLRHPAILSCAVHGEADFDLGERVRAVVQTAEPLDANDVRIFLADHLARDKWPRVFTFSDKPVRDDAGKFRKPRKESRTNVA